MTIVNVLEKFITLTSLDSHQNEHYDQYTLMATMCTSFAYVAQMISYFQVLDSASS